MASSTILRLDEGFESCPTKCIFREASRLTQTRLGTSGAVGRAQPGPFVRGQEWSWTDRIPPPAWVRMRPRAEDRRTSRSAERSANCRVAGEGSGWSPALGGSEVHPGG